MQNDLSAETSALFYLLRKLNKKFLKNQFSQKYILYIYKGIFTGYNYILEYKILDIAI